MSENYNMGQLGVIAPFKAKEGTITITEGASAHGNIKVPVMGAPIKKGDYVALDGEMIVKKAGSSDTIIGIAYNTPKWDVEPTTDYTQAQALAAGVITGAGALVGTVVAEDSYIKVTPSSTAAADLKGLKAVLIVDYV